MRGRVVLCGFVTCRCLTARGDGVDGTGEPLAALLREGRANANDAADQIAVLDAAVAQLPTDARRRLLVRGDTGAGVHALLHHVTDLGLEYSVGVYARQAVLDALAVLPRCAWRSAVDVDGDPRDGAQVAGLICYLPDTWVGWPPGMRVIARRERPHPGAQLRLTDHDGWRSPCSPRTPRVGGWPISSCGTAGRPGPRTASAD